MNGFGLFSDLTPFKRRAKKKREGEGGENHRRAEETDLPNHIFLFVGVVCKSREENLNRSY